MFLRTTLRMNEHKIHDIIVSIVWYKMKRNSFYLLKVLWILKIKKNDLGVFKVSGIFLNTELSVILIPCQITNQPETAPLFCRDRVAMKYMKLKSQKKIHLNPKNTSLIIICDILYCDWVAFEYKCMKCNIF